MIKTRRFFVSIMILWIAVTVSAQVTTATISGKVTDANNEIIIGATIQAIHEPSGTLYGAITNTDGRYTIQGMRTGGPYKVEISFIGYETVSFTGVSLHLGETTNLSAQLKESSQLLEEVVVIADAVRARSGAASNFKSEQITATPTINRNVYDIVRLSPQANINKGGGISFAGSNNRYNSFQIDGMVSNDVFGLAGTGTNGGQTGANPISLDAIEEIQVVVSPFDVRQSGFTGGGINAVTKSGTNRLRASVYTYYNNEDFYGKWSQVNGEKQKLTEQTTKVYGGTLGGALIKDKLFFFVSAEYKFNTYPSLYAPGYVDNYITPGQAQQIVDKYKEYTGIGESFMPRDVDTRATGLMARLDWNIDRNNKLCFRYQLNDSYQDNSGSSSNGYSFNGSGYRMANKTNSFVLELNSHMGDALYNEFRAGATFVRDRRKTPYSGPNVSIGGLGTGGKNATIGTENSSAANALEQDIYTVEDNLSLYAGNHTFTFGTHNELYRMKNLFIQSANGAWSFNSLEDFLNDNPYQFIYKYSDYDLTGSYQWAGTAKAGQFGFYAQDKWNISDNFAWTYGLRFDIPTFFNSPTENPAFNGSDYSRNHDVRVGEVPNAKLMVSPRVGFRWYVDKSRNTLVRGGLGIFTGRAPFVWLTNCWNNTGMEMKGTTITTATSESGKVPSMGQYATDPVGAMKSESGKAAKPDIVTVSKDFRFPQVFRANLALERRLPADIKMTLEGLYSKTLNNVYFENLALTDNGAKVYAVSSRVPASAATYYSNDAGDYYSIINLRNTNKGYSYTLSAKFEKSFAFGLDLMAAYTFGHAYSVNDGISSIASSNWKNNYAVHTNSPILSHASFDTPHRVIASASYVTPRYLNGRMATTVSLIYNGFSGGRYSLTLNDGIDFNGDGYKGNSLLYIPTESELEQMTFVDVPGTNGGAAITASEGKKLFAEWIANDKYAKNHRGEYAERNSNMSPWENHFDLHIAQDFFYLKERGSKIQLTLDITNVANLLNHDWGTYYSSGYNKNILKVNGLSKEGNDRVAKYSFLGYGPVVNDLNSRWHAQVGLRVTF